jgi:hypothetical protein
MPLNNTSKNLMLEALADVVTHLSMHDASPGTTGTNEITGGSPAYARKAITFNAAAGGILTLSNIPVFDIPEDLTLTHFGLWVGSTAGTFYGGGPLIQPESFVEQGTYTFAEGGISL